MNDVKRLLADGDPLLRDPEIDAVAAQAMRQRVLVDARNQPAAVPLLSWPRPLAVAGALAACLALGVSLGIRIGSSEPTATASAPKTNARRQMQFSTPGGTRIIWTFHEDLDL